MKKLLLLFSLLIFFFPSSQACTTAVISGKFTKDGRPLLWKHRDTWAINNHIKIFEDGKYRCIGLVNSKDKKSKSIWIGYNEKGFAIMNSASYNLNNDTIRQTGYEGRLMKEALQICATLADFEAYLANMELPRRLEANFGVIDANGGAAYYEVGNFTSTKFDANDPTVAPYGYIIRTNHSVTGKLGKGGGYIRYKTANDDFQMAIREGRFSPKSIVQGCSRNMTNSLTHIDLNNYSNIKEHTPTYASFTDYIPRRGTSSSVIIEGVKPGEDASNAIMWAVLGWPLSSVCMPLWLDKEVELPNIVKFDTNIKDSPLCNMALQAKKAAYSYDWGYSYKYYINVNALINADNSGLIQIFTPLENRIFAKADKMIDGWRKNGKDYKEMRQFYQWIDQEIPSFYREQLNIIPTAPKNTKKS